MSKTRGKRVLEQSLKEAWDKVLAEIDETYPTELSRIRALRGYDGTLEQCKSCKGELLELENNPRKYRCLRCLKRGAFFKNTLFDGITHTRAWLAAIIFLDRKVKINAFQFHKLCGIAYSTARTILLKLGCVASEVLAEHERAITVSSDEFKGAIGKRSRVTASHRRPCEEKYFDESLLTAEAMEISETTEENDRQTRIAKVRQEYPEVDQLVEVLTKEVELQLDALQLRMPALEIGRILALLTWSEMNNLVIRLPGDHYVLWEPDFVDARSFRCICIDDKHQAKNCAYHKEKQRLQNLHRPRVQTRSANQNSSKHLKNGGNQMGRIFGMRDSSKPSIAEGHVVVRVHSIKKRIRRCQYYISRKYLQAYIGLTWCATDKQEWGVGKLLEACAAHGRITPEELRNYNTPHTVVIFPPRMYSVPKKLQELEEEDEAC